MFMGFLSMYKKNIILFFLILFFSSSTQALVVGSNTAVSREEVPTFPAADSDNEMQGFGAFENGFILEDNSTTCTFDSFFQISGDVTLKGGTLYLQKDLVFTGSIQISGGHIDGNGYSVAFPSSNATNFIPSSYTAVGGVTGVTLRDSENISGDVFSVDWSYDGDYVAVGRASATGAELRVFSFNGSTLALADSLEIGYIVNCVRGILQGIIW